MTGSDVGVGDIVVVAFPFTDLKTSKRRPALVLAQIAATGLPALVVVSMITSQLQTDHLIGDCRISRWKEAGLLHPCKVRLAKLVSLEERMLLKKLGSLQEVDRTGARRELRKVFAAWV